MEILFQPCGEYQTNCYIYKEDDYEIIIDPGYNALEFIKKNTKNPIAILNTHGHFDHIWDNQKVKDYYNIPIYVHNDDNFLLEKDIFEMSMPTSTANFLINDEEPIKGFNEIIKFFHFPGHTPGCCMVQIKDVIFSGDFIFKGSIGRWDFPFSDKMDMKNSIKKFEKMDIDYTLYPGHGSKTNIFKEQEATNYWLNLM
jgi:glyoxylase-like metal-dependent hydrolase (beta-lactamase superfamily II)